MCAALFTSAIIPRRKRQKAEKLNGLHNSSPDRRCENNCRLRGHKNLLQQRTQSSNARTHKWLWVLRANTSTMPKRRSRLQGTLDGRGIIRTTKSIMETRPIYHRCNETIRGHVFCSFLALLLKTELERRIKFADLKCELGADHSWSRGIATGRGGFSRQTLWSTEPGYQRGFGGAAGDWSRCTPHVARVVLSGPIQAKRSAKVFCTFISI